MIVAKSQNSWDKKNALGALDTFEEVALDTCRCLCISLEDAEKYLPSPSVTTVAGSALDEDKIPSIDQCMPSSFVSHNSQLLVRTDNSSLSDGSNSWISEGDNRQMSQLIRDFNLTKITSPPLSSDSDVDWFFEDEADGSHTAKEIQSASLSAESNAHVHEPKQKASTHTCIFSDAWIARSIEHCFRFDYPLHLLQSIEQHNAVYFESMDRHSVQSHDSSPGSIAFPTQLALSVAQYLWATNTERQSGYSFIHAARRYLTMRDTNSSRSLIGHSRSIRGSFSIGQQQFLSHSLNGLTVASIPGILSHHSKVIPRAIIFGSRRDDFTQAVSLSSRQPEEQKMIISNGESCSRYGSIPSGVFHRVLIFNFVARDVSELVDGMDILGHSASAKSSSQHHVIDGQDFIDQRIKQAQSGQGSPSWRRFIRKIIELNIDLVVYNASLVTESPKSHDRWRDCLAQVSVASLPLQPRELELLSELSGVYVLESISELSSSIKSYSAISSRSYSLLLKAVLELPTDMVDRNVFQNPLHRDITYGNGDHQLLACLQLHSEEYTSSSTCSESSVVSVVISTSASAMTSAVCDRFYANLHCIRSVLEDKLSLLPGGGVVELLISMALQTFTKVYAAHTPTPTPHLSQEPQYTYASYTCDARIHLLEFIDIYVSYLHCILLNSGCKYAEAMTRVDDMKMLYHSQIQPPVAESSLHANQVRDASDGDDGDGDVDGTSVDEYQQHLHSMERLTAEDILSLPRPVNVRHIYGVDTGTSREISQSDIVLDSCRLKTEAIKFSVKIAKQLVAHL